MKEIYAVRCTERLEDEDERMDGIAGYFTTREEAEMLVSWIKEKSLTCDFNVFVETIELGKTDDDFISWVIS